MGTTKTTDTTGKFDPQSMNRYQGWQNSMMPVLQQLFQNPTSSPFFNQNLQQNQRAASQVGGRNTSNALLNFQRSGIGGGTLGGGAKQSLLAGAGRYASGLQYQGWNNTMNQAQSDRWNAASLGSSMFQPFNTGQTTTQKSSGLGTWLPQVAAIAAGVGLAPFTGGASLAGAAGGMGSFFAGDAGNVGAGAWNPTGGAFGGTSGGPLAGGGSAPMNPFSPGGLGNPGTSSAGTSYNPGGGCIPGITC